MSIKYLHSGKVYNMSILILKEKTIFTRNMAFCIFYYCKTNTAKLILLLSVLSHCILQVFIIFQTLLSLSYTPTPCVRDIRLFPVLHLNSPKLVINVTLGRCF